jgi:hypothetical protein
LTPEQLLEDVMQFGDAKDKEERVGNGFATGAFEKAKELLRNSKRQREEKLKSRIATKVATQLKGFALDSRTLDDDNEDGEKEPRQLTAEEELRQMFEAGENLADGRIAKWEGGDASSLAQKSGFTTEQDVDALIAGEKDISSYARVLDDELVELEVRLNKSPGEDLDGPRRNPKFDIMSGPEVYNPNVDPETAVNWPGALPGSKDIRLPKELTEAVTQAKFAADALTNLREEVGSNDGSIKYFIGDRRIIFSQLESLRQVVKDSVEIGLIRDPLTLLVERSRLQLVLDELWNQPEERFKEVAMNYKDLLLSDNFVQLVCDRMSEMVDRDLDALRKDDYSLEANMRPLFDDAFVAYLKYAVEEEEGRLARAGVLDDPEHNQWLYVLKIVQNGVYTELARGINRYIDHIQYVLRMETPTERRMLLEKLIDVMPTLDVRPFVAVVDNIAGALGDGARGAFEEVAELGEMSNKILQLHRDVQELLPPERIALKARDADEWAAAKKKKLFELRKETKKRLTASRQTEECDEAIENIGRQGEVERFDQI